MITRAVLIRDAALSVLLLGGVFAYNARYCDDSIFTTDGVDYLRDVRRGFWANYFDTQSGGLWGLISVIRNHPEARSGLWDYLERNDDAAADLHFHVPVGLYPNMVARNFGGGDRAQRLVAAGEGGLVAAIVFAGLRFAGVALPVSFLTAAFVGLSPAMVSSSTDVSPHMVFLAAVLIAGFALARFLETGAKSALALAAGSFAASAATLELSIIAALAFFAGAGVWLLRMKRKEVRFFLMPAAMVFAAVSFIVWPGGWIRGGYALSYGVFIFLALFRRENYFGSDSLAVTSMRAAQQSSLILIVFAMTVAGVIYLLAKRRWSPYLQIFALLAAGFAGQGMLNHFRNPAYASHFIVTAGVVFALCVQSLLDASEGSARYAVWAAASAGMLLAVLGARGWPALSLQRQQEQRASSDRVEEVTEQVKRNWPVGSTIVSNNRFNGVWRYYLPGYRIEKTTSAETLEPRYGTQSREYAVIALPELLSDHWRQELERNDHQKVGGFVISRMSAPSAGQ
ncbi:MAG TPA: hypothetical protein VH639_25540 [Bryobacteraceae bacterium]|jgi:hypothetical protein